MHGSDSGYTEVPITLLPTAEGGRATALSISSDTPGSYRPHLRVKGEAARTGVALVDGPDEPLKPGASAFATVAFLYALDFSDTALTVGKEFEILEGPSVVGFGRVTRR